MERLTRRMCGGWGLVEGCEINFPGGMRRIVERLAAYENTGLEPEEIAVLLERAEAIGNEVGPLLAAKLEGRLVVLPQIKKYKTLYWLWGDEIMPVRFWGIKGGCVDSDGKYHVNCEMRTKKDRTFHHRGRDYTYKAGEIRYFYADSIGKDVFFTREAAKAALEKREVRP